MAHWQLLELFRWVLSSEQPFCVRSSPHVPCRLLRHPTPCHDLIATVENMSSILGSLPLIAIFLPL